MLLLVLQGRKDATTPLSFMHKPASIDYGAVLPNILVQASSELLLALALW
jgi:hypothetical protein